MTWSSGSVLTAAQLNQWLPQGPASTLALTGFTGSASAQLAATFGCISIDITASGAIGAGSVFAQVPLGYQPSAARHAIAYNINTGSTALIKINSNRNVEVVSAVTTGHRLIGSLVFAV